MLASFAFSASSLEIGKPVLGLSQSLAWMDYKGQENGAEKAAAQGVSSGVSSFCCIRKRLMEGVVRMACSQMGTHRLLVHQVFARIASALQRFQTQKLFCFIYIICARICCIVFRSLRQFQPQVCFCLGSDQKTTIGKLGTWRPKKVCHLNWNLWALSLRGWPNCDETGAAGWASLWFPGLYRRNQVNSIVQPKNLGSTEGNSKHKSHKRRQALSRPCFSRRAAVSCDCRLSSESTCWFQSSGDIKQKYSAQVWKRTSKASPIDCCPS